MSTDLRTQITAALAACAGGDLTTHCIRLLDVLGYRSAKRFVLAPNSAQNFAATFGVDRPLHAAQARTDEWREANLLFQLTDSEVAQTEQMHLLREEGGWNRGVYRSFLFLAIGLAGEHYSRTALATITRAVNRLFMMPTPIFFRYGDKLTLAIILRRPGKRDAGQDVLEKVTLIKDIDLRQPHAAHIRILEELALVNLRQGQHVGSFDELQSAWAKTLDISELNKRFYQELANWYHWAVASVTFPAGAGDEDAETRHAVAVIRLITRLIFVWFIKEKGLVPAALFDRAALQSLLTWDDPQQSTYYKAILQNLFFATLNTEMERDKPGSRRFRSKPTAPNAHYGVPSLYRYQARFTDPAAALRLFADIPFLNGGLFECLDRPEAGVRVDGFSDRGDNPLRVPDELFFGTEHAIDLNEVFGTRGKQYKVRGLLDIFARYKFTVEENTPIDEEVALDPELLGKVFENLLAAYNPETRTTARKQTGSFYTPREIVDYMVDEALIAALAEKLGVARGEGRGATSEPGAAAGEFEARLRQLFAYTDDAHQFTPDEVAALIDAIDALKMLDPACGSGAFPMGILHKLVFILRKLDPNNVRWKQQQLARAQRDRELAEQMEDEQIREHAVREADARIAEIRHSFDQADHELDYTRKLYLIENCIYGVDIQPIAVQIAKLRFFISLVADQRVDDAAPNRNVRALPNLETKFVAANSLIALPRSGQMLLRNPEIDRLEEELRRVRQRHFTARTTATKKKHREEDARLRARIGELLRQDGWPADMTVQLAHWDPYNQHTHAEFFDPEWMFGLTVGFDVVIGNPPYVSHDKIPELLKRALKASYECYDPFGDLYCFFIERAIKLQDIGGVLSFITSNSYLRSEYGRPLRRFISQNNTVLRLVNIEDSQIFESAIVNVAVLLSAKQRRSEQCWVLNLPITDRNLSIQDFVSKYGYLYPQEAFRSKSWSLTRPELLKVFEKIAKGGPTLEKLKAKIRLGLATGYNDAFIINAQQREEFRRLNPKNLEIIKPILRGRDISRYHYVLPGLFILLTKNGVNVESDYPDIYAYLNSFGPTFKKRGAQGQHWTNLRACAFFDDFKEEKIVWIELTDLGRFALCKDEIYLLNTAYFMLPPPGYPAKYLLGLLNSSTIQFYLGQIAETSGMGTTRWINNYVKEFPIPRPSSSQAQSLIELVDLILAAKSQDPAADVSALEAVIDALVYRLYGLTAEEIKIVEGAG